MESDELIAPSPRIADYVDRLLFWDHVQQRSRLVQEAIDYALALAAERGTECYDPPVPHSALGHRGDVPYETTYYPET